MTSSTSFTSIPTKNNKSDESLIAKKHQHQKYWTHVGLESEGSFYNNNNTSYNSHHTANNNSNTNPSKYPLSSSLYMQNLSGINCGPIWSGKSHGGLSFIEGRSFSMLHSELAPAKELLPPITRSLKASISGPIPVCTDTATTTTTTATNITTTAITVLSTNNVINTNNTGTTSVINDENKNKDVMSSSNTNTTTPTTSTTNGTNTKIWGLQINQLRVVWTIHIRDVMFNYFITYLEMFSYNDVEGWYVKTDRVRKSPWQQPKDTNNNLKTSGNTARSSADAKGAKATEADFKRRPSELLTYRNSTRIARAAVNANLATTIPMTPNVHITTNPTITAATTVTPTNTMNTTVPNLATTTIPSTVTRQSILAATPAKTLNRFKSNIRDIDQESTSLLDFFLDDNDIFYDSTTANATTISPSHLMHPKNGHTQHKHKNHHNINNHQLNLPRNESKDELLLSVNYDKKVKLRNQMIHNNNQVISFNNTNTNTNANNQPSVVPSLSMPETSSSSSNNNNNDNNNNNEIEISPMLRAVSYNSNNANTPRTTATARTTLTPRTSRRSANSLLQRSKSARGSFLKSKIDKLAPINANDFLSILHRTQTFFTIELLDPQINFIDLTSHSSILIVAGKANIEGKIYYMDYIIYY